MTADPEASNAARTLRSADQPYARHQIIVPAARQAAGLARHAVRETLAAWGLSRIAENAILLVSELISNAVQHARGNAPALELRLAAAGHLLRIEVLDADPRAPRPRTPAALDESGFGLVLVEALADDWGVRQTASGKAVWIELHTGQPTQPGNPRARDIRSSNALETYMSGDTRAPANSGSPGGDPATPSVARMFDCYLAGNDNFAAEREAAQKVLDSRDQGIPEQITAAYDQATARLVMRGCDEVRRFLGECAMAPPGVVYLTHWYRHITGSPILGDGATHWAHAAVGIR